jgi:hypothetical protein
MFIRPDVTRSGPLCQPGRNGRVGRLALAQPTTEVALASPTAWCAQGALWASHRAPGTGGGAVHGASPVYAVPQGLHREHE